MHIKGSNCDEICGNLAMLYDSNDDKLRFIVATIKGFLTIQKEQDDAPKTNLMTLIQLQYLSDLWIESADTILPDALTPTEAFFPPPVAQA